ncbi:MAG: AI-2E family transporter [Bacillota bacterium]|nr:AI-2E family transporter [Bacillota bacterium]
MNIDKEMKKNILTITYAGMILFIILYFSKVIDILSYIWQLFVPFIIGFGIAFVLNIIIHQLENTLYKNTKKNKRIFSFMTMFLLIIVFIGLICFIVGPELIHSIKMVMKQTPIAYENFIHFLKTNRNMLNGSFTNVIDSLISLDFDLSKIFSHIIENWKPLFNSGFSIITNTVSSLSSFFIGFVFSIYLLFFKETLSRQLKIASHALIGKEKTDKICRIIKLSSDTFTSFITCQCLEACILGTMFVISMFILQMPYALLMGIIIAITALIPVFGAFIGCFIGIIMIGIINPLQAVAFVILFLVLQQIEGNFIYPHVVGNSVGLPSIWVFVAVVIGGNLMGILGMFLFIPLTSIVYTLFKEYIKSKSIKS